MRPPIYDVDEASFEQRVVERSREIPVVVDFWAEWCGPCRQLTPALERAAQARAGKVELAKVDTDANQRLAAAFQIQGIPAVKAFRDGKVAAEFTGALPPAEVERFFDALVPSEADELALGGDEESLRSALEVDPRHQVARRELARLLIQRGDADEALDLLKDVTGDFLADGLVARARLADDEDLKPAFEAWDRGDYEGALEPLLSALDDPERRDDIRRLMVAIFTELGPEHRAGPGLPPQAGGGAQLAARAAFGACRLASSPEEHQGAHGDHHQQEAEEDGACRADAAERQRDQLHDPDAEEEDEDHEREQQQNAAHARKDPGAGGRGDQAHQPEQEELARGGGLLAELLHRVLEVVGPPLGQRERGLHHLAQGGPLLGVAARPGPR